MSTEINIIYRNALSALGHPTLPPPLSVSAFPPSLLSSDLWRLELFREIREEGRDGTARGGETIKLPDINLDRHLIDATTVILRDRPLSCSRNLITLLRNWLGTLPVSGMVVIGRTLIDFFFVDLIEFLVIYESHSECVYGWHGIILLH